MNSALFGGIVQDCVLYSTTWWDRALLLGTSVMDDGLADVWKRARLLGALKVVEVCAVW